MRFGKHLHEETEAVQMAPLIDIVFLTLVFFMTTAAYTAMESELDIDLPTASSAVQSGRLRGEIYINLRDDGGIVLNNRELTIPELQDVLNRVAENFPGGSVIVRGDRDANFGKAIAILNACKNADIQNVKFAAIQDAHEPPN